MWLTIPFMPADVLCHIIKLVVSCTGFYEVIKQQFLWMVSAVLRAGRFLSYERGKNEQKFSIGRTSWINFPPLTMARPLSNSHFRPNIKNNIFRLWADDTSRLARDFAVKALSTIFTNVMFQPALFPHQAIIFDGLFRVNPELFFSKSFLSTCSEYIRHACSQRQKRFSGRKFLNSSSSPAVEKHF